MDKNGSFLVINDENQPFNFIVHTDHTLNEFLALNDDVREIDAYKAMIEKREKIPFFGIGKDCWEFELTTWEKYLHPSNVIKGRERYYWAITNSTHTADVSS